MCEPPTANVHTMKVSEVTGDICSGIIFSHLHWVYKAGGQPSYLLCFQLLLLSYHNSFPTVKINLTGFLLCLNLRASRKRTCTQTTRGDSLPLNSFMCQGRSCLLKSTDCGLRDVFLNGKWTQEVVQTTTSNLQWVFSDHIFLWPWGQLSYKPMRLCYSHMWRTEEMIATDYGCHSHYRKPWQPLLKSHLQCDFTVYIHNREIIPNLSSGKGGKGVKHQ